MLTLRRGFVARATPIACSSSRTCSRRAARRARRCRWRSPPAGRSSARRRSSIAAAGRRRFDVPFHALCSTSTLPTYEPDACPLCAQGLPVVKPGSRPTRSDWHGRSRARAEPDPAMPPSSSPSPTTAPAFVGWQRQADGVSMQGAARGRAARCSTAGRSPCAGAGRTDAGVHALGQVASVDARARHRRQTRRARAQRPAAAGTSACSRPSTVRRRLSRALRRPSRRPIAIGSANGAGAQPVRARRTSWHVPAPTLDVDGDGRGRRTGSRAATTSRRSRRPGTDTHGTERESARRCRGRRRCDAGRRPGSLRRSTCPEGTGFLRHMVRTSSARWSRSGRGRRPPGLGGRGARVAATARCAGRTAPAAGLFLVGVDVLTGPARR